MGKYSGLFGFIVEGRWMTAFQLLADGTLQDRHGVELDPISLDVEILTVRAVASAVITSGKRTRLDVVCSDGLTLPVESGKGRGTLRDMIVRRCGEHADEVIAAYTARYFSVEVQKVA